MRVLVVGLGALGTVYACLLREQGHEVWGSDREDIVQAVKKDGLQVSGIWGDHSGLIDGVVEKLQGLKDGTFDLVVVTVKSFHTAEVMQLLQPLLAAGGYVILAQNGYGNYETAIEHIPEEKVILARVIFGAETLAPGKSKVTVIADDVLLGSPRHLIDMANLEELARVFYDAGIPTRASDEIMKYVWGKIIYNSALNPLGAIQEVSYGKLALNPESRMIMEDIIQEIFAVMDARQISTLWPDAAAYIKDFYEKLIPLTAGHHSSMLQDIQMGRKTEIDYLNGAVCKLGRESGIATPANEMMLNLINNKEALYLKP